MIFFTIDSKFLNAIIIISTLWSDFAIYHQDVNIRTSKRSKSILIICGALTMLSLILFLIA